MTITEKELIVLLQTTADSLKLSDGAGVFSFDEKTRRGVTDAVLNRQNGVLVVKKEGEAT